MSLGKQMMLTPFTGANVCLRKCLIVLVLLAPQLSIASEIEWLFGGIRNCHLDDVVFVGDGVPLKKNGRSVRVSNYLNKLRMIAVSNGVARFEIHDRFYGLDVAYIDLPIFLPRDDNQVWRIYFNHNYEAVRKRLSNKLNIKFPLNPVATDGYIRGDMPAILLERDTGTGKPFIGCRKTEMGD